MGNHCVSVKGLFKRYGKVVALNGVDFSIRSGEIFSLLGPNGAGKTTLIQILCGLIKADEGAVTVAGLPLETHYGEIKRKIGLCPQETMVWEHLTCLEQLEFCGLAYGLPLSQAKNRSKYLLSRLGLEAKGKKLAKTLSGGMRRRLNLALALVHDPPILILDEPQAGLDPQSRILVRDYLRDLAEDKTILLTTHDMEEADRLSNRLAILDRGEILAIGSPGEMKEKAGGGDILELCTGPIRREKLDRFWAALPSLWLERHYSDGILLLGAKNILPQIASAKAALAEADIPLVEMRIRKRSLEDVFIAMTGRGLKE